MRLTLCLGFLAIASLSQAQVWEKRLAPGLTYREEITSSVPRIIHVLKWSLGTPLIRATAELGHGVVFDASLDKGREQVSKIVSRSGGIAGINADFFQVPYTGDPLGLMLRPSDLISVPLVARSVLAWSGDKAQFGVAEWKGDVVLGSDSPVTLDGINELASNDHVILNTETSGIAMGKSPDIAWVVKLDSGDWTPEGSRTGEVVEVVRDLASRKVAPGFAVVIANGKRASSLNGATVGSHVRISNHTTGFDWSGVKYAVGGGPTLIHKGLLSVDWKEQRFKDTFALQRHPRSAVGITTDGDLCLVAVDGRAPGVSEGATLDELAHIMQHLGCVEAMNMDGGGSTCLNIEGLNVNRPSDGKERPIANAIVLFQESLDPESAARPASKQPLSLSYPSVVALGSNAPFVAKIKGSEVPNSEVVWSATGSAWIDQGGLLHPIKEGPCVVTGWSNGVSCAAAVVVGPSSDQDTIRVPSAPRGHAPHRARPSKKPPDTHRA